MLVFFSLSHAKLPAYILPVFPALALLIAPLPGECFAQGDDHRRRRACFPWARSSLCSPTAHRRWRSHRRPLRPGFCGAAVLLVSGGIAAAWLARRARAWALIVLAAAGFFAGQALMLGHEPFGRERAGVGHLAALRAEIAPQTPIYGVELYEYALPFYLGRTLIMVGTGGGRDAPGIAAGADCCGYRRWIASSAYGRRTVRTWQECGRLHASGNVRVPAQARGPDACDRTGPAPGHRDELHVRRIRLHARARAP